MRLLRIVPDDTKFDFVRFRRISFPISAALSIAAILLYFFHGLNFGIDFKGGTLMEVRSKAPTADLARMRATIGGLGLGEFQLQQFGTAQDVLIRISQQPGGEDAQQAAVIRQMVRDLNFPLEIVVCPTTREPDGLAMSSRNVYLDAEQRKAATVLYRALNAAKEAYESGERDAETLRQIIRDTLAAEPLAQMQYVSCPDYDTLEELDEIKRKALLSMAVFMGKTRLIDNFVLE